MKSQEYKVNVTHSREHVTMFAEAFCYCVIIVIIIHCLWFFSENDVLEFQIIFQQVLLLTL